MYVREGTEEGRAIYRQVRIPDHPPSLWDTNINAYFKFTVEILKIKVNKKQT